MSTSAAARTLSLVVALLLGLTACGDDPREAESTADERTTPSATAPDADEQQHRVVVRLEDIRGSAGHVVAGVLYRGSTSDPTEALKIANVVGGFGSMVEDDPFSRVRTITDGSRGFFPFLTGPPAVVEPGDHLLLMWRGRTLGGYSTWVPAAEPHLTGCLVQVAVGDDAVTTVTVTGFPRQPKPLDPETMRPCLP